MLKLTRNPGERIILQTSDGEISIEYEKYSGQQIKIAIEAPKEVVVLREELLKDEFGE